MNQIRWDEEPLADWVHDQASLYRSLGNEEGDWLASVLERIAYTLPAEATVADVRVDVGCGPDVYECDGRDEEVDPCSWN